MRDATERALLALERDDPDAASRALDEGAAASKALDGIFAKCGPELLRGDPELRAEADAVRVLQALAIDRSVSGRAEVAAQLETLTNRDRDLRGYRPADAAHDRLLDLQG